MKTQLQHFYSSHNNVMDRIHTQAFILIVDKARYDAQNDLPIRYPNNSDYVKTYNIEKLKNVKI